MSKFNNSTKGNNKTTNRSGFEAYKMSSKENLVTSVLTSFFGEPKYYGSTDNDIIKLATECAKYDPEFLVALAVYARKVGNMRSVSHVLTAIIAREAHEYTRKTIKNIVVRPDDILEIMSCYKTLYGKPFPNAMKREIADVIQKFNEYSIAKYNSDRKELTFRDVLRITHPVPKTEEVSNLFNKIINDTLETPYTWETELSAKGNTKEVWNELIDSNKLGYMASLRNLRNIIKADANYKKVLEKLSNEEEIKNSKQLPFRFYSAYKELIPFFNNENKTIITDTLDKALSASANNLPTLEGRTLIAVDVSGSMSWSVSRNSKITCRDIATVLGCLSSRLCEDATVIYFSCKRDSKNGYTIKKYGKYDSVLRSIEDAPRAGGGTDMSLPFIYALNKDSSTKPFDRIIYFSDNECNSSRFVVQKYFEQYKREKNPNLWVHAVDLQGYGTQQFIGKNFNLIAGWGDSVLEFIDLAEKGIDTLVNKIENYYSTLI